MPYSGNEGPDQTAHLRSLIRAFDTRLKNQWILYSMSTNRICSDQIARMRIGSGSSLFAYDLRALFSHLSSYMY